MGPGRLCVLHMPSAVLGEEGGLDGASSPVRRRDRQLPFHPSPALGGVKAGRRRDSTARATADVGEHFQFVWARGQGHQKLQYQQLSRRVP